MKLKTEQDGWISGRSAIGRELVGFYQNLFSTIHPNIPDDMEQLIEPLITGEENHLLIMVPDANDIFSILWKMSSEKAPGPDGMTMLFFKHFWEVVGLNVIKAVQEFL